MPTYLATARYPDGRHDYAELQAESQDDASQKAAGLWVREAAVVRVTLLAETLAHELEQFGEVRSGGCTLTIQGDRYRMEQDCNIFNRHTLAVSATDEARLRAHWDGFVQSNARS